MRPAAQIATLALALVAAGAPVTPASAAPGGGGQGGGGQGGPGGAPAPANGGAARVAVAPLTGMAEGSAALDKFQALVVQGAGAVPGFTAVPDKELRAALRKARRKDLEACEGDPRCLSELGRLVGASYVIAGEVGELGEGHVAYLKAVDVAQEKEIGSTTAVFASVEADRPGEARAAAYRLLAPGAYVGLLELAIDVKGAVVYVDGRKVGTSPIAPLEVPVGTHALRVTHEKYRDFVRFVDVKFDATTRLEVPMTEFPVVQDQMVQQNQPRPKAPVAPLPWYRQWWAVAGAGAVLFVGTALIVGATTDAIDRDREVTVGRP